MLETRSADRRKADPKFQKQDERIKKFARPQGPALDLAQRGQVQGRVRPRRGRPETGRRGRSSRRTRKKKKFTEQQAWESDFYNDEVVRIVADYLTLGSKVLAANPVRAAAVNP